MLIPRGRIIHENLATSYVLVEALVADLCDGGFSGVVAIALREIDGFVVIANGSVGAVVERVNDENRETAGATFDRSTLSKLSAKTRAERGLLSIRSYSGETADAVAGRINAQSLYARLSTEFTDLETMLSKLAREADREWFVEINTDEALSALVHIRDRRFHVIASRGEHEDEWDTSELADDAARQKLFMECKKAAGTFDVYFKDPDALPVADEAEPLVEASSAGIEPEAVQPGAALLAAPSPVASSSENVADPLTQEFANELSLGGEEFAPAGGEDETMTELKRLMGEIAGTIEGSAQAVDRHDGFAMCLRAGQLKIADRYPFLDPFASEFEYLTGEIVFVGQATAEQFVAGLTEALSLAIKSLAETNTYGEKFRAY
ncbi:MAG TPA: hypothetical protein VN937_08000, partial [Blastocatellia bacterium]|nr:hypothetical protein [Blastocatellia bacterium]